MKGALRIKLANNIPLSDEEADALHGFLLKVEAYISLTAEHPGMTERAWQGITAAYRRDFGGVA